LLTETLYVKIWFYSGRPEKYDLINLENPEKFVNFLST
jgi:hypothetical protein